MNLKKYNITYHESITNWDEALPLGSGKLGCLIYGDGKLRLSLDRIDLWDDRPAPPTLEENYSYRHLVSLVKSGKDEDWAEWIRMYSRTCGNNAYPSKITAGRLELDFAKAWDEKYFEVDIEKAIATVKLGNGQTLEAFVSADLHIGVAKITGDFNLDIHIPNYISDEPILDESYHGPTTSLSYPRAQIQRDGDFVWYNQETFTDLRYGIVVYQEKKKNETLLYFTIATNQTGDNFIEKAKQELKAAAKLGYDKLLEGHATYWKGYWKKSSISVADKKLERLYYRSWYLFASTSRKGSYPMPLQGVWTADDDRLPPWRGDYHFDTNVQLSYQSYLKANRLPEGEVLLDYLWDKKDVFTKFAKNFFGVDGYLLPSTSTVEGKPMGGWAQYSYSPTMTIWMIQAFDDYYLYTGDETFLKERAYPIFHMVGQAFEGLLEEKNGKLYLPLSSSPEIYDDTRQAYLEPNSNFDLALLIYLYRRLVAYCDLLGLDSSRYQNILSKLDDIAINDEGIVMLDKTQLLPETHRHFSHLMCLYPLHVINCDSPENKRIFDKTMQHIEMLGTGWWVGFSFPMAAQIYAMAYIGNAAYERLRQFANGYVADNGFHLNGDFKHYGYNCNHYRPFTLESLYGYCDALHQMLLQDHQGYLHLFPALPMDWKEEKTSFKDLRTIGGILVSSACKNGKTLELRLKAPRAMKLSIKNTFGGDVLNVVHNKQVTTVSCPKDELLTLQLEKGTTVISL